MKTKKLTACGVLSALAFGLSYIELMLPSLPIPGAKLGIANISVMIALYILSPVEAALVSLVRLILSWLIFGSFTGFIYSLCGSVLSLITMAVLKKTGKFSLVGVSIGGGVCHNIGQLFAAVLFMGRSVLSYLPVLLIAGAVTGAIIGLLVAGVLKSLKSFRKGT